MKQALLTLGVTLAALAALHTFANPAHACKCAEPPPFLVSAQKIARVVHARAGKVTSPTPDKVWIEFEILEVLKGKLTQKTIKIPGATGRGDCKQDVNRFEHGQEYILILRENFDKYGLSTCTHNSLRVKNGTITTLQSETKTIPALKKFLAKAP